jgi:hypothetical protein
MIFLLNNPLELFELVLGKVFLHVFWIHTGTGSKYLLMEKQNNS